LGSNVTKRGGGGCMIKLRRETLLGGDKDFESKAEVIVWLAALERDWMPILTGMIRSDNRRPGFLSEVQRFRDELEHTAKLSGADVEKLINKNAGLLPSTDSPFGVAIKFVSRATQNRGLHGAFYISGFGDENGSFDWVDQSNLAGIAAYNYSIEKSERKARNLDDFERFTKDLEIDKSIDDVKSRIESVLSDAVEGNELINSLIANADEFAREWKVRGEAELSLATQTLADAKSRFDGSSTAAEASVADAIKEANAQIAGFTKAHAEQTRLESASALWKDRHVHHLRQARGARTAAFWVAPIGFAVTFVVAALSFLGARSLLETGRIGAAASPATKTAAAAALQTLRPTFTYEVGLAAAATFAWLTLYIWLMRLIIRAYTTEQHLAIDASARAALAETYFSLTKENKAEKEDRAIVLASIFRPVTDGMVKDDGPPAFTPAALLSSLVSAKGG
jgi:ABC-type multidrug transport system fused ATPase/permease subunit